MPMIEKRFVPAFGIDLKRWGLYLIFFLCVFIPFRMVIAEVTTDYIKLLPDIMIIVLFIVYSFNIRFRYRFMAFDCIYLLFLTWAFISTVFINHNGIYKFLYETRSLSIYYIMFFILRNYIYNKDDFLKILRVLNLVTCVLFVLAVIEKIGNKTILFPVSVAASITYANNYARVYGMFFNPNTYGAFLVLTTFFNLYASIVLQNNKHGFLMAPVLITSLLLTQSRSAYAVLLVGLVLILVFTLKGKYITINKRNWLRTLSGVLMVGVVSAALFVGVIWGSKVYMERIVITPSIPVPVVSGNPNQQQEQPQQGTKKPPINQHENNPQTVNQTALDRILEIFSGNLLRHSEADGRLFSIYTGMNILRDYPLWGSGFGSFGSAASLESLPDLYERYGLWEGFYADNQYITIIVETGLVGAVLFLSFLIAGLTYYRRSFIRVTAYITVAFFGLFYNVFEVQIISMLFWTFLIFTFQKEKNMNTQEAAADANICPGGSRS